MASCSSCRPVVTPRSTKSTNRGQAALVSVTCGAAANASSYARLATVTCVAEQADAAVAGRGDGAAHGRLDDLDDRHVVALAGVAQAGAAGAVAGDDEHLHAVGDQLVHGGEGVPADLGDRQRAVRPVRGVADVQQRLGRQLVEQRPGHRQPADPGVEDPDRRVPLTRSTVRRRPSGAVPRHVGGAGRSRHVRAAGDRSWRRPRRDVAITQPLTAARVIADVPPGCRHASRARSSPSRSCQQLRRTTWSRPLVEPEAGMRRQHCCGPAELQLVAAVQRRPTRCSPAGAPSPSTSACSR